MQDSDRRSVPRLKTLITTEVTAPAREMKDEEQLQATCLDLSATGMVFAIKRAFAIGGVVIATLELPSGSIHAYATVLRCEPTRRAGWWRVAVKFDDLFDDDRRRITEFVKEESGNRVS
jgi:c-di-GMP-binding flagellar brake protein YcgR